jgi:hypothetical protein
VKTKLSTLLTDVRVGLSALLAAQGVLVAAVQGQPTAAKIVEAVLSVAGVLLGVVTAIQDLPDATPAAPASAPTAAPPATK